MSVPEVVVAGAAGDIGRATLDVFAKRGLAAVGWDKKPAPGLQVCDVLDDDAMATRVAALQELRYVVVVAGGGDLDELNAADVTDESLEVFRRVVETNLHSAFNVIRHTVPLLRNASGDRSITLISSINAYGGYGAPGYSAAKAGLSGLTRSLAPKLGKDGIRINVLTLGTVDTSNARQLSDASGVPLDDSAIADATALGRPQSPEDVATAIAAFAIDLTSTTGAEHVLDAGQTILRRPIFTKH
ncbi:SDR family oxidoreductase [Lentzea sp. NBRC 105346]|uniref:SDR family NAD(P)-dependent oxidoreductase n=1 Tax=Lentzea sp. NBRC 105346 TaxID=3032205 RepID=UPI002555B313|nr:SDR family oxidoreductase [Lentzea sp. NBRC 105346]